jgi:hypothetical protein
LAEIVDFVIDLKFAVVKRSGVRPQRGGKS